MKKAPKLIAACLILFNLHIANAQNTPNVKSLLTADSLASGNLKDLLTSFFQLSFNNLTGPSKELNFNSNPYAVMLRTNPSLAIDKNYAKYRTLRNLNFGFGLRLDTSFRFNGFSSGIRYAIINQRDSTTSEMLFGNMDKDSINQDLNKLIDPANDYIDSAFAQDPEKKVTMFKSLNEMFTNKSLSFAQLDSTLQKIVLEVARRNQLNFFANLVTSNPDVILMKQSQAYYEELKREIQKKLLWTVSLSDTTYNDQFLFSNVVLKTEILKGFGKSNRGFNWEYSIPATLNLLDDTLQAGKDLKRLTFTFQPEINLVIRNKNNDHSFLELGFNAEFRHNFTGLYENEKRTNLYFNGILRVRVFADIWVPLEFKYDPGRGNVFGFISTRLNFSALNNK